MPPARPNKLDPPLNPERDHLLGDPAAGMVLVEYGSYGCPSCHAAHQVIANLWRRFGDRMVYVFRHFPISGGEPAREAAALAEHAARTTGRFWPVHDALMRRGPEFGPDDFTRISDEFALPPRDVESERAAERRVQEDVDSARRSGAVVTPTFFINGRRYEGPWDESALAEAMVGSLGHRLQTAALDFVRWGPSAGFLLLLATILAIGLVNSPLGFAFETWWGTPFGFVFGAADFRLRLIDWVNDGLLTVFFLVVGLEIKREFTIGRLATRRAAALPVAASIGGMIVPAAIYLAVAPAGPLFAGWGVPIATDTAFAIALIVLLGDRVPVELRVFLTATVIVDDLAAIAVLALFHSDAIHPGFLAAAVALCGLLIALNRFSIYRALPYAVAGIALWACLHASGVHATLAGVILAVATPTRPPANLRALMAQAATVIRVETKRAQDSDIWRGPSEPALRALDVIHGRIESPASKLLRSVEPWSSYAVLPVFAFANAGVIWSSQVVATHGQLMAAIILGLVIGKPVGIFAAAWLAVHFGAAEKPEEYTWRQLAGAGALAGIGFTMSLFIAGRAFPHAGDFAAAKVAIFAASVIAGALGTAILWSKGASAEREAP